MNSRAVPSPADFGGKCLIGECDFSAQLLLPATSYLGLRKMGSYIYGSWRDGQGNLLRALRGIDADASTNRFLFRSDEGGSLEHDDDADRNLWSGPVTIDHDGDVVTFRHTGDGSGEPFTFEHAAGRCAWTEPKYLDVAGNSIGPAVQWFNTWEGGACYAVTGKYRTSGTFLGRPVEGFIGHEIHYLSPGATWRNSPYGQGREICWQQIANEYEDGTTVQATFGYGDDGWGFAMVHDEAGRFECSTDVTAEATVTSNDYPETITYRFSHQAWTWRIDPQGERPMLAPGSMRGADGTCTRDGDTRRVRWSMGNSDWWTDGRADPIIRR